MTPMLKPILSRFADVEMLMPQSKAAEFHGLINGMAAATEGDDYAQVLTRGQTELAAAQDDDFWGEKSDPDSYDARVKKILRPYNVVNGILQIPVRGVLLNNFPYQYFNYATGYAYIWEAFKRGMADGNVKGIAFIIHSPGGEVAGNFDLVDRMYGMRGTKPIAAFAHEYAYSAAFSIYSVADPGRRYVSRSGGVGSIGVVTSHIDISGMMEQVGWKVTFIHFGEHKVDGNPYAALPEDVKARIQERIDALGEEFVSIVARNTGLDAAAVKATEALTYPAKEAIQIGLADKIAPLDDALASYEADLNQQPEDEQMSKTYTEEEYASAVTAAKAEGHAAGKTEGHATGLTEGAKAAQDRMNAVMSSDAGKARPKAAVKMLSNTKLASMDAEGLVELLADMPEESAAAGAGEGEDQANDNGQDFNAAMTKHKNNVGTDDKGDEAQGDDVVALAKAAGLVGF